MKAKISVIMFGIALFILAMPRDNLSGLVTADGFQVQPICAGDLICHFEGDPCGTAAGDLSYCPGAWQQGLCIAGGGQVDLGDDDAFSAGILEIECQVEFSLLPGTGNHAAGLITKYMNHHPGSSEWGLFVEGNITPHPTWMLTGNGTAAIRSESEVLLDSLYHVRALICGEIGGIWVNGTLVAAGPIGRNLANTDTPVIIGNSASGGNYFYGMIDEVRIGCAGAPCAPYGTEESSWGGIKKRFRSP